MFQELDNPFVLVLGAIGTAAVLKQDIFPRSSSRNIPDLLLGTYLDQIWDCNGTRNVPNYFPILSSQISLRTERKMAIFGSRDVPKNTVLIGRVGS